MANKLAKNLASMRSKIPAFLHPMATTYVFTRCQAPTDSLLRKVLFPPRAPENGWVPGYAGLGDLIVWKGQDGFSEVV